MKSDVSIGQDFGFNQFPMSFLVQSDLVFVRFCFKFRDYFSTIEEKAPLFMPTLVLLNIGDLLIAPEMIFFVFADDERSCRIAMDVRLMLLRVFSFSLFTIS